MASGDTLCVFTPLLGDFPASSNVTFGHDTDYGFYVAMTDSLDANAVLQGVLPENYGGGGVTVEFHYLMGSANTTDDIVIGAAFQRLADGDDLSGAVSWTENTSTVTVPNAAEEADVKTVTFTDGADMASVAAGDAFRLRVRRLGSNGSDTAAGDMRLFAIHVKET